MTQDQIHKVCDLYTETLEDSTSERLMYVSTMLPKMKQFEDVEKAHRWLGFVQGVLWAEGIFTIDEMREHNRSKG